MADNVSQWMSDLQSTDRDRRCAAAEKLARAPAESLAAAVALTRAVGDQDEEVREWAVAALEGLGPPLEQDVAKLSPLLTEADSDIAYWSATLLGRLGKAARGAVEALAVAVVSHPQPSVRQRSAWALGMIGPAAANAAAALKSAAASDDPRLVREARHALEQIGG